MIEEVGSKYHIENGKGEMWEISINQGTCSCPDYEKNRAPCKHIFGVLHHYPETVTFKDLPLSLREDPRFTIDQEVLEPSQVVQERSQDLQQESGNEEEEQRTETGTSQPSLQAARRLAVEEIDQLKSLLYAETMTPESVMMAKSKIREVRRWLLTTLPQLEDTPVILSRKRRYKKSKRTLRGRIQGKEFRGKKRRGRKRRKRQEKLRE
jgi:uncharacterized Zn finger protein